MGVRQKTGAMIVKGSNMSESNRTVALHERAVRVIKYSKHSVLVSQVVDNTTICVKIEAKLRDAFEIENIKKQIYTVFSGFSSETNDAWNRADELFLSLSNTYNDNKISITISDSSNCGVTANYYNTIPQQLIKI